MDEDELRQFYMAAGAALSVGGFVVLATNAMTLALTSRHFAIPWLAYADFGAAIVGLFGGATIIARALMGKTLFGSKRASRVGNNRLFAQECLGAFLLTGQYCAAKVPEDRVAAGNWLLQVNLMVKYFYGPARGSTLISGMTISKDERTVTELLQPSMFRLTSIIDQVHTYRLSRDFDRSFAKQRSWYKYLLDNCPYDFEPTLPPEE
jgi:hypothetical protein